MKNVSNKTGLYLRLGALAAALLLGQQAMAAGTRAGTVITNTATVDYEVNGINQNDVSSLPVSFVVDRRVDLSLVTQTSPGDLDTVSPGQNDNFVDFLLTNTSNSDLDIDLVLAQVSTGTTVDGTASDDSDLNIPRIALWTAFESGTPAAPAIPAPGTLTATIDNIPADDGIRIRVWGNVDLTAANGSVAGLQVTATALADDGSTLTYGVANTDGLENVDANNNNGIVVTNDGFIVAAAVLSAVKSYTVVSDPLSSGLAIPGAVLQYEIVVSNAAGAADATSIVITDAVDPLVTFLLGGAGGSAFTDIEVDDGVNPAEQCTASDLDADGCSFVGGTLTVGVAGERDITLTAGASYTVRFQVEVPTTTPTP